MLNISDLRDYCFYANYTRWVSEARKGKILKLKMERRKLISLFTELLMKYVVAVELTKSIDEVKIMYSEKGKPFAADVYDYEISVSHSENYIVCVGDRYPVGIDIEQMNYQRTNLLIAKRFFDFRDYKMIETDRSGKAFFKVWTAKEAYSKMSGQNLYSTLKTTTMFGEQSEMLFKHFEIDNYMLCVSLTKRLEDLIVVRKLDVNHLLSEFKVGL